MPPRYDSRWTEVDTPSTLTPDGVQPTPDEQGGIFVLPCTAALNLDGELTCDHRDGAAW